MSLSLPIPLLSVRCAAHQQGVLLVLTWVVCAVTDNVFDKKTTTRDIFNTVGRDMVGGVVTGFNGTLLALAGCVGVCWWVLGWFSSSHS